MIFLEVEDYLTHREALHEHVGTVAITEFLLRVDFARLMMMMMTGGGVGDALPATALVHVGAVLSDGVCAALRLAGVATLHGLPRLTGGWQIQAVHPAVS